MVYLTGCSLVASMISSESYIFVSIHVSFWCFWLKSISSKCAASHDTRCSGHTSKIQTERFGQGDIGAAFVIITADYNTDIPRPWTRLNCQLWKLALRKYQINIPWRASPCCFLLLSHYLHSPLLRYSPQFKGPHLSQSHELSVKCSQEVCGTFTPRY